MQESLNEDQQLEFEEEEEKIGHGIIIEKGGSSDIYSEYEYSGQDDGCDNELGGATERPIVYGDVTSFERPTMVPGDSNIMSDIM